MAAVWCLVWRLVHSSEFSGLDNFYGMDVLCALDL